MKAFSFFVGVDIGKDSLQVAIMDREGKWLWEENIANGKAGFKVLHQQLNALPGFSFQHTIFCMEHTGIYNYPLLGYLTKQKAHIWLENALHIKQCSGLQRGKTDKLDAQRIARFAYKNRDDVKLWQPARPQIQKLKYLMQMRARLLKVKKQLTVPMQEAKSFVDKDLQKLEARTFRVSLQALEKDLQQLEKQIDIHIQSDAILHQLFTQVTSVTGIGRVTAATIIADTNEFKDYPHGKKYACAVGVVPFAHQSGKSIKGKPRVSHLANKTMKTLLHMAACSAVSTPGELKAYYERKLAQGKHKMSVLNAVRNKLVLRIFAVVREQRKYEKIYPHALA